MRKSPHIQTLNAHTPRPTPCAPTPLLPLYPYIGPPSMFATPLFFPPTPPHLPQLPPPPHSKQKQQSSMYGGPPSPLCLFFVLLFLFFFVFCFFVFVCFLFLFAVLVFCFIFLFCFLFVVLFVVVCFFLVFAFLFFSPSQQSSMYGGPTSPPHTANRNNRVACTQELQNGPKIGLEWRNRSS